MKVHIEDTDDGILEIEGVKITLVALKNILSEPPKDMLFSVKRDGDQIVFTAYRDKAAAAVYFDSQQQ